MSRSKSVYIGLTSTSIRARPRKLKARWRVKEHQDIAAYHSIAAEEQLESLLTMKQIRVDKSKLLAILKKNREDHRGVFLEAQKEYRVIAIEALDAQLKAAREGKPFELARLVALTAPEDHTADYDRSIQMLEMSIDTEITVDEREFQNYVQDVWNWSRDWAVSNIRYMNKNSRQYDKVSSLANE
jgi:hypothetical protein